MSVSIPTIIQGNARNLILESPHQGRMAPEEFQHHSLMAKAAQKRLDSGIKTISQQILDELGGTLIYSDVSRLVVDLNRGVNRVDSRVCSTWPGAQVFEDGGVINPIARMDSKTLFLYENGLSEIEVEDRLRMYWYPYHESLQSLLHGECKRYGHVMLISLHSTQPTQPFRNESRPVIYLGTHNGKTCDPLFLSALWDELTRQNLCVVSQGEFQGGFTTQAYGAPPQVNTIQVELDQRFINEDKEWMLKPFISALKKVTNKPGTAKKRRSQPVRTTRTYIDPATGIIWEY